MSCAEQNTLHSAVISGDGVGGGYCAVQAVSWREGTYPEREKRPRSLKYVFCSVAKV